MERRARRNETLAEVGALAAGIAHELRNGLNPISGSVECLQRELKLDGENAVLMELIATRVHAAQPLRHRSARTTRASATSRLRDDRRSTSSSPSCASSLTRDPRCGAGVTVRFERGDAPATGARGPRADPAGVAEPRRQRARGAAAGGDAGRCAGEEGEGRAVVVEFDDDGPGHRGGGSAARRAAVLHDEGRRHRSRARHRAADRRTARGHARVRERARPGHDRARDAARSTSTRWRRRPDGHTADSERGEAACRRKRSWSWTTSRAWPSSWASCCARRATRSRP